MIGASTNLALPGAMNDLQPSQPAKAATRQPSALDLDLGLDLPAAEPNKPKALQDEDDKYDISRLACTE